MKKLVLVVAAALLGMFVVSGSVYAQDKLAYIDLSRAFSEYNKTKDYDKKLTEKENGYVSERDKKVGEFNALRDKFALLSDKDKEAKKGELESKAKTLKDFVTQKKRRFARNKRRR